MHQCPFAPTPALPGDGARSDEGQDDPPLACLGAQSCAGPRPEPPCGAGDASVSRAMPDRHGGKLKDLGDLPGRSALAPHIPVAPRAPTSSAQADKFSGSQDEAIFFVPSKAFLVPS